MKEYFVGIDAGSTYVKTAFLDDQDKLAGYKRASTGINPDKVSREMINTITFENNINPDQIKTIVATGYSRRNIESAQSSITEINAHARGAVWSAPEGIDIHTIIDIGGQDSKVIILDKNQEISNFAMNDKCAAGTGRFLESLARVLELDITQLGPLSKESDMPLDINSTCVVFAESEVISLVARKKQSKDIVAGIHRSLARRISGMAKKAVLHPEILLTGGGGLNQGIQDALEEELFSDVHVPEHPQLNGAIGAALIGRSQME